MRGKPRPAERSLLDATATNIKFWHDENVTASVVTFARRVL
jgi:hypothetical protein